jgi:serine/threonine protein kinase
MVQNRYLVVQPIGKGGMGEVYLAVDQRLGSAVALKRTFFSDDSALGTAFEREARILARLRHPVLPKVIDHFAENGDQFLVMEHISGDDLSKRLESTTKPFPLNWVMFWADQLLDALGYLHTHEPPIIHRDIKPQNLKLTDENHIVLLDFGLSKDFDTNTAGVDSASVAGYSPHFAAMEQIRGTGTDGRSDLYSLSATLYQLMTGVVPIDALSRADALLGGRSDPIVPLNELNPEVPEAVSNVILKGIALRQEERFLTASEMQRSLRRAYNQGRPQETEAAEPAAKETIPSAPLAQTPPPAAEPEPGFDATLQMQPDVAEPPKQSEIKTAVMTAADLTQTDKSGDKRTRTPNAPKAAAAAAAAASSVPGAGSTLASDTEKAGKATGDKKRSGSKKGVAIAGILGFLLVSAAIGGGGWYAYNNFLAGSEPPPAPAASPTPEQPAVAEVVPEQPTNASAEVPSNVSSADTGANDPDTNSNSTSPPSGKPTPQTKATPVRVQKTPGSKPTPKPRGDDRTVILQ